MTFSSNHEDSFLRFLNPLLDVRLSLRLSDLKLGNRYYLITQRINGKVTLQSGEFVNSYFANSAKFLTFQYSDASFGGIKVSDYNLFDNIKRNTLESMNLIFDDFEEALNYKEFLLESFNNKIKQ